MNKLILASLIAGLSGVAGTAQTAKASHNNNEAIAAIGGFIGGVIVGSAIHNDHREPERVYSPPPRVIVEPRYSRGHWDTVTVRTWVEGRWFVSFDDCGRRIRSWTPGHYEFRHERVWVDGRHDRRYDYGRR
jgi:hypothetical protein